MMAHAIFTPGQPGWLEHLEHALAMKPDSIKGYTIGDNTNKDISTYPWRMDDETGHLQGLRAVREARHQEHLRAQGPVPGLGRAAVPASAELLRRARRGQGGEGLAAAQLRHLPLRLSPRRRRHRRAGLAEFEQTGRVSWVSDLAEIPQKYGVNNVYGDVGQLFAQSVVAEPRLGAALMGILVKGLGADHVCWGTDAIWTGSPQWQIEALRRLEIPEDMQKQYGFAAAGRRDGTGQDRHLLRQQHAPLWLQKRTDLGDRFASMKADYLATAPRAATCATATRAGPLPARPEAKPQTLGHHRGGLDPSAGGGGTLPRNHVHPCPPMSKKPSY